MPPTEKKKALSFCAPSTTLPPEKDLRLGFPLTNRSRGGG